jgi:hypothetical protein
LLNDLTSSLPRGAAIPKVVCDTKRKFILAKFMNGDVKITCFTMQC